MWSCIGVLFAVQIAGSLAVQHLFGLSFGDIAVPIALLALGSVLSFLFHRSVRSKSYGPWKWWVPVIVYALFIFSLSNRSYPEALPTFSTKLFHPIEFAVFGGLLCVASFSALGKKGIFPFAARVLCIGVLFGLLDELHQAFIPGRTARILDVAFWDLLGIACACGVFLVACRLLRVGFRTSQTGRDQNPGSS